MNDYFTKFADNTKVYITSFAFHDIYSGLLAGTKHRATDFLLKEFPAQLPKGTYYNLNKECFVPNESLSQEEWMAVRELRPFRYCLKVRDLCCDCCLTVYWWDFAPPQDIPLRDYIEKHTSAINFAEYAEEIDW